MIQILKNSFPNFLTCCNLACGIVGLFLINDNGISSLPTIEILIVIAGIADFFDGFAARILGSKSNIGKDLDSLADAVTFGILPCIVSYAYLRLNIPDSESSYLPFISILIGLFSIIRLAIFNNDTRQTDSFIGVPTPANAFFLIFLLGENNNGSIPFQLTSTLTIFIIIISSFLLVAPIPLLALKFKNYSFNENWPRFLLIILSVVTLVFFGKIAVPMIFIYYLTLSILLKLLPKNAI